MLPRFLSTNSARDFAINSFLPSLFGGQGKLRDMAAAWRMDVKSGLHMPVSGC
jgi:hypothetical protein